MLRSKRNGEESPHGPPGNPVEATSMDVPRPVINSLECKACGRCIVACPKQVLVMSDQINARDYHYVEYVGEGCIGCGNCFYTCPEPLAIEVYIPQKDKS